MENLIEELTKVNPSNLSEEGLKLFNKINEIIDENIILKGQNEYQYDLGWKSCEIESITKSLIKEKIEELKAEIEQLRTEKNVTFDSGIYRNQIKIDILEELLKGEDK